MTTTINAANISMGFDASKLTKGYGLTRAEMTQLKKNIQDSVAPIERYNQEINALKTAMFSGALTADRYAAAQEKIAQKYNIETEAAKAARIATEQKTLATRRAIDEAKRQEVIRSASAAAPSAGSSGMMLGAASRFAGPAAIAFGAFQSLKLAADAEQAAVAFEVLTGSASKATAMLAEMRALDQKTPVSFAGINMAGKTLLGYGLASEKVMPALRHLADISMGNEERFKSLALAYGQVQAAGRLMGQEVLQMVNNGFNPLQEISKNTGISMADLKEQMQEGKISFEMVAAALESATSAGGRFNGMSDRMTQTIGGRFSKLTSDFQRFGIEVGQALEGPASAGMSFLSMELEVATAAASKMKDGFNFIGDSIRKGPVAAFEKFSERQQDAILGQERFEWSVVKTTEQLMAEVDAANALKAAMESMPQEEAPFWAKQREASVKETVAIQDRYDKMMMGEEAYEKMRLKNMMTYNRMTEEDRQRIADAEFQLDAIKNYEKFQAEKKKNEELAKQKAKQAADEMKRDLDSAKKSGMSAMEAFDAEEMRLRNLEQNGLGKDAANRLRMENVDKFQKSINPNNVSATIAPALKAGSVEAYKFLNQQKDKAYQVAQKQVLLQEQANDLLRKQTIAIQQQPVMGVVY